jgi:hypothetical protein
MSRGRPQREHDAESARLAEIDAMWFGWLGAIVAAGAVLWLTVT